MNDPAGVGDAVTWGAGGADPAVFTRIDAIGLFCPVPLHMTGKAFRKLPVGAQVELVGDDPGLAPDMEDWAAANGHRIVRRVKAGRVLTFVVEKGR